MQFEGIYTPVITPMGPDREIDEKGWVEVIEHLIGQGMHGLVLGGTTGENYALTTKERVRQFQYGNEVIAGRVPWIAGVNDIRTEDVVRYAVAAREAGASAILLAVPPYSIPNDKELAQHALAVDKACGLPVMLYNYPGRSGTGFGREFLERVSRNSNFTAIKESSGDINRPHPHDRAGVPASAAELRRGRPGPGVLRLGCALVGVCCGELPWCGVHRAL